MDDHIKRALLRALGAFVAVLAAGSTAVFAVGLLRERGEVHASGSPTPSGTVTPSPGPSSDAWLAWVPGGLPEGFGSQLTIVPAVADVTVATADIAWMTGSVDAAGVPVDQPIEPYMIPIDATGIEPSFTSFVPEPERRLVKRLQAGEGILSETAARIRGLGEGSTLTFSTGQIVKITGTLPDTEMGGYELLVTRPTGETIGVSHERYVVFHVNPKATASPSRLASLFLPYVPTDHPFGAVEVRAPGETRYLRANDRELPPMFLKLRFGEFTAHPDVSDPDTLVIDPVWTGNRILTRTIPVIGEVTCHAKVLTYLTKVMARLQDRGASDRVLGAGTCFDPVDPVDGPDGPFSARAFGAAIDINAQTNQPGDPPTQPNLLLRAMDHEGFGWGGRDAYPQGSLFRFIHPPKSASAPAA